MILIKRDSSKRVIEGKTTRGKSSIYKWMFWYFTYIGTFRYLNDAKTENVLIVG